MPNIRTLLLTVAGVLLALTTVAPAQDYPNRSVRVIVPFPAGGVNDIVGRLVATQLSERLGKQFIVDNRTGAGGVVGTEIAANASKDGYTLLVVSIVNAVNPWLYKLPYDPVKAFVPVAFLATAPNVLVVNPELPVKSVKELLALVKDKPGDVPYATAGVGSFMHLSAELFKLMAGIDMLHVPFKGGGPALVDLVAGHTKVAFATTITTSPMLRSGKLRALGVGALKRSSILPELPTIDEAGVPGYDVSNWIGLMAPAGVPAAVVDTLHKEITAILQTPETQKQLAARGAEVLPMSSAEFGAFMEQEMAKWQRVVKEGKIKADH
jgi:tripartite-type tricarboxylate transporter receptor subunit TctC